MNDMKKLTCSYDHIACLWRLDGQEQEWKQEEHLGNQHRHPTSSKATVGAHGDELQETWPRSCSQGRIDRRCSWVRCGG